MNVVLIGYRCSGKTCVGKELAQRMGRAFIDCDEYIEQKTNLTIREIFDIAGEAYFRMLESDAIAELSKLEGRVIATGGGAVLKYKNIRNLKRNGVVVYLDASVGIVAERMEQDPKTATQRPALTDKEPLVEIREQMQYRRPYYLSAADLIIRTDSLPLDDVVGRIVKGLKAHGIATGGDDRDEAVV